jgi:siderophore synthetase component
VLQQTGGREYYRLTADQPGIEYRFYAQLLNLDHWAIDVGSLEKYVDGVPSELDAVDFMLEFREQLGIDAAMLPVYLEEIINTLYGSAYKHTKPALSAAELARADFQTVETAMTEGHPAFVANNGRIGFDALDYLDHAPEAAAPARLIWLAAHKNRAEFNCAGDLSYAELLTRELEPDTIDAFNRRLLEAGLWPDDFLFIPAHPWQWHNKLAILFAPDIADGKLVCLGYGEDRYLAQQSIRTFFNTSRPERCYVKTALSVLNMGFMRGLSPYYMRTTPAINDWIHKLIGHDPFFAEKGFGILREVAAVGYRNVRYEAAVKDSPYHKMLAALWRESPVTRLKPGQRLMTMAALLHRDRDGAAVLPALIESSGIGISAWLQRYLRCYLQPQLHCLYAYHLVFTPHGENVILVLENNAPAGAIMKDIGEDIGLLNPETALPEPLRRLAVPVPEELVSLSIFINVFDGVFRFLAQILYEHGGYTEHEFWQQVADCILDYQRDHPQFAEKFRRYDLFAPEFARSCLNRLQLKNNREMIDLNAEEHVDCLQFAGTLRNPIAMFNPGKAAHEMHRRLHETV